ncbi:hypothetical protein DZC31_24370 [Stenotrophomonas rhizophila]|uniref:hypothetical protein n=1 Tax=Pseudomonas sp. TaxID=306 RepID=UPI000E3319A7|nr:hypothetical protein [Pseudomonas sp.]AXQ49822.1 hypothetical protein DZC31_24370 [Stenotrophomonas rhizophila]
MTLYESIVLEVEQGALPRQLRATDLLGEDRRVIRQTLKGEVEFYRIGFNFFRESHIRTQMANAAQGTGYWVKAGQSPQYKRIAEGLYEVLGLNEQEETAVQAEAPEPMLAQVGLQAAPSIEARLVNHLIQTPFQIFDRKRRTLYPVQSVTGFKARLDAYFWPSPATGYSATEKVLDGFVARARLLAADLDNNAGAVLQLFAEICEWGGVRLPTEDAQVVVDSLRLAQLGSRKQVAAMNGAWTKLYAMFYPDDFLIYDSRVATALLGLAEQALTDSEIELLRQRYPALGRVAGRGGSRPRATSTSWRNAYTCWAAQLDANALGQAMLAALNQVGPEQYRLRHLEATLFMEGY